MGYIGSCKLVTRVCDMKKPSGEFFDSLGQYVYAYVDRITGEENYTGKGRGDRCWAHVTDKEYDPADCVIIARNLERFEGKKDWQSFLLESFLISTKSPKDNIVSGRYKECFVMTDLSFLFNTFQEGQRDMFSELVDLYNKHESVFRGTVGYTETRGTSFAIETGAKDNKSFGIKVSTREPHVSVYMKTSKSGTFEDLAKKVVANLGHKYDIDTTSNKDSLSFPVADLDEAVELWKSFVG